MKILLMIASMLIMTALTLTPDAAQARHLEIPPPPSPAASVPDPIAAPTVPAATESWKDIVGEAVLALGAAGLAAQLGVDPAWLGVLIGLTMIIVVLVAIGLMVRRDRRARRGPLVYAGDYLNSEIPDCDARTEPSIKPLAGQAGAGTLKLKSGAEVPVSGSFDGAKFLDDLKAYFVRLQTAWDRGDLNDIREFTTLEMLAEFKLQIERRGSAVNKTSVELVEAELLQLENIGGKHQASVQFVGMIGEEDRLAASFLEIWNLVKPSSSNRWVVVEIQQIS